MTVIAWTPGHANIQGNEEADILAKNAAEEAKHLAPEDNIYTLQYIKKAAHDSIIEKWQRRWEIGETGRQLFEKTETVGKKIDYDYPTNHHPTKNRIL